MVDKFTRRYLVNGVLADISIFKDWLRVELSLCYYFIFKEAKSGSPNIPRQCSMSFKH